MNIYWSPLSIWFQTSTLTGKWQQLLSVSKAIRFWWQVNNVGAQSSGRMILAKGKQVLGEHPLHHKPSIKCPGIKPMPLWWEASKLPRETWYGHKNIIKDTLVGSRVHYYQEVCRETKLVSALNMCIEETWWSVNTNASILCSFLRWHGWKHTYGTVTRCDSSNCPWHIWC